MQILQQARHYEVIFDYNPRIIAELKKIKGARFNAPTKTWIVPLTQHNEISRFAEKYCPAVQEQRPEEFGVIPDMPELTIDIPLLRSMYPYQAQGVAYSIKHERNFVADKPGLGKSFQAVAAAIGAGCKCILVVCPASLKINWQKEFKLNAGMQSIVLAPSIKSTWQSYYKMGLSKVFITNYESLKTYFVQSINKKEKEPLRLAHIVFKPTINLFDCVIFDESHRLKDATTQQSKLAKGIAAGKKFIWLLTGTPVVNKPKDLMCQLSIMERMEDFGGWKHFNERYCGGDGRGATNLRELNYKLSTTCFYQRLKEDVLKDLPAKTRQVITCDITTRKEYDEAVANLGKYLKDFKNKSDAEVQKSMAGEIMVQIGVCKNISAKGKLPAIIEDIDEILSSGEKVGVFIHQKEIALALKKNYPHALTITGADTQEARNNSVEAFQTDPACNLILLSIKAAGVGLTLTAASICIFVELPWHSADCDQCEDRFHRIGQKGNVLAKYFLGDGTIDEQIYQIIEKKRAIADAVTGNEDNTQKEIIDLISSSLFKNN